MTVIGLELMEIRIMIKLAANEVRESTMEIGIFEKQDFFSGKVIGEYARNVVPLKAVPTIATMLIPIKIDVEIGTGKSILICSRKHPEIKLIDRPSVSDMTMKPWYESSLASSVPNLSDPIVNRALVIPTNKTPVTPQISPGTIRRYSLNKTVLEATRIIKTSQGSHFWDRDDEQYKHKMRDSTP